MSAAQLRGEEAAVATPADIIENVAPDPKAVRQMAAQRGGDIGSGCAHASSTAGQPRKKATAQRLRGSRPGRQTAAVPVK